MVDILRSLRNQGGAEQGADSPRSAMETKSRPQTITELIDAQVGYHQKKIDDLKEAKEAISPEVEKALNALAKIS